MMAQGLVMHVVGLLLISLLIGGPQAVFSQDFGSCTAKGESVPTVGEPAEVTTDEAEKPEDAPPTVDAGGDETLSQSFLPQLIPPPTGIQSLNALRLIFPALGSILLWGSQFPTTTLIGAANPDNFAAASKVVLVLADDAHQQGAKTRVVRQDEPSADGAPAPAPPGLFGQLLPPQLWDTTPILGQSLIPESVRANMAGVSQRLQDSMVGQAFQGGSLIPQGLSQIWANGQGLQSITESMPQGITQVLSGGTELLGQSLTPQNLLPPTLNPQSLLSQALNPQSLLSQSNPQAVIQALNEASSALQQATFGQIMVGQAPMSQLFSNPGALLPPILSPPSPAAAPPPPASPDAVADPAEPAPPADAPAPPAPAVAPEPAVGQAAPTIVDQWFRPDSFVGQMRTQIPESFLTNMRQILMGGDATAAASDISEVRVRPDGARVDSVPQTPQSNQLNSEKTMNNMPLLWFRQPGLSKIDGKANYEQSNTKSLEDLKIEAKLQAFERQVIAELKLLQEIERVAKEMRATAKNNGEAKHYKGPAVSPHKQKYPLSSTPVHKITREDIERALNDDYLQKLLQKELQRRSKTYEPHYGKDIFKNMKRQAFPTDRQISKEDLVKMMAYAYRMANGNSDASQAMMEADAGAKEDKKAYAAYRMNQEAEKQQDQGLSDDKNSGMMNQGNPAAQTSARQWVDAAMRTNPRQWSIEPQQMPQTQPIMLQRLWAEHMAIQQQEQRQRAAETAKMEQMEQQEHQKLQQHRAWVEETAHKEQEQRKLQQERQWVADIARHQQEQRQMAEQTAKMEHEEQQQQQQVERQRQWVEEAAIKEQEQQQQQQQRHWADHIQTKSESTNNNPTEQLERTEDSKSARQQTTAMTQEQQQAEDNRSPIEKEPMTGQQRQWAEGSNTKKGEMTSTLTTEHQPKETPMQAPQQRQWSEPPRDQMSETSSQQPGTPTNIQMDMNTQRQMQQPMMMVGEATPQMPENRERIKVNSWDLLGLGGNKRKLIKNQQPAIINYQQVSNDYGRPYSSPARPIYQGAIAYGGGGGGGYGSNAYGGSGGYGSNAYGGGGAAGYGGGGSGYGAAGAYRAAVGNDEIDEMLRQHQTLLATHFRK